MFLDIVMVLIIIAAAVSGIVVLRGKNKWERLLGLSLVSVKINMLVVVHAFMSNRSYYLDVALVYIILSYVGVKVLVEYMSEGGKKVK